jgi:hypothetical protein
MGQLDIVKKTLTTIVALNKDLGIGLTGEKNLTISKDELIERVEKINPGYLEVMEMEANILVRQGLFRGYFKSGDVCGDIVFDIPDWDKFISSVDAFYKVCYAPGSEDEDGTT